MVNMGWPILAFVAMALGVVQAAQQPSPRLPEGPLAFVIDLDTSGGFSGRGLGGVTVDSNGSVGASRIGGSTRGVPECRTKLSADELQSMRRSVEATRLQTWPASFAPAGDDGCCDRFQWTLRMEQRLADGQVRKVSTLWYDANEGRLPKEVAAIKEIAMRALKRALETCGPAR
jgi:hypothetical protein